ncbi:MAG: hypothetical protein OIF50_16955 [Flavobacteriaceae bacterium]|nr:hypothetical protein [Flavobacteriaceae bacterium]
MKEIKKIYVTEFKVDASGVNEIGSSWATTGREFERPSITFYNSSNARVDLKNFLNQSMDLNEFYFSREELFFLMKTYLFEIEEYVNYKNESMLTSTNKKINDLYRGSGKLLYFKKGGFDFLVIFFKRWQLEIQPRGAGEDQYGEDIFFVHGIWEGPILEEEMRRKLLNNII